MDRKGKSTIFIYVVQEYVTGANDFDSNLLTHKWSFPWNLKAKHEVDWFQHKGFNINRLIEQRVTD
jgi:hypothetical protein